MGAYLQWLINTWLSISGKSISFEQYPWLKGPYSKQNFIGDDFYKTFAETENLKVEISSENGLLKSFDTVLDKHSKNYSKLQSSITRFYEKTAQYKMEVWSEWFGFVSFFARILITHLSTKMNQLNLPIKPLETCMGMSSEVIRLSDENGEIKYNCWLRKTKKTGKVVYAGFYSSCYIEKHNATFVKTVFPLPKGNVTVILKVEIQEDGSVKLVSSGNKIGDAGYYRIQFKNEKEAKVKYIPMKEVIHVFEDDEKILRTDHTFNFFGMPLLHLHYKILPSN
jgi:hypothetical protein